MIWHFFEVWLFMLGAFAVGCPLGALAYTAIAKSPLADLQGDVADVIGDVVDGIKSRLGIGPVWRPEYRRIVERHAADELSDREREPRDESAARPPRLIAGPSLPTTADQSDQSDGDGTDDHGPVDLPVLLRLAGPGEAFAEGAVMARPAGLAAPRNGVPDDLQRIRGVGRRIEVRLNALGIYHFGQIAAWTPAEMRWVAQRLAFPERIEWDDWVGQAIILASGGETGFVKSADRRRARRRQRVLEDAIESMTEADDTGELESDDEDAEGEAFADEGATFASDAGNGEGGTTAGEVSADEQGSVAGEAGAKEEGEPA